MIFETSCAKQGSSFFCFTIEIVIDERTIVPNKMCKKICFFFLFLVSSFANELGAEVEVQNLEPGNAVIRAPKKPRKKRNAQGIDLDETLLARGRVLRQNVDRNPGKGKQ